MPYLLRNSKHRRGVLQPAVLLGVNLRMPAGGSCHDQMMCKMVGRPITFEVFMDTLLDVLCGLRIPGIHYDNEEELCKLLIIFKYQEISLIPCISVLAHYPALLPLSKNHQIPSYPENFSAEKACVRFYLKLSWTVI